MSEKIKSFINEEWKQVDFGRETKTCNYSISNYGRIKSVDKFSGKERLLKGAKVRGGLIVLNQKLKDNTPGVAYVHRFVAENFVEQATDEHEYIVHKDYDKANNKWLNLAWVTEEEWKEYQSDNPFREKKFVPKKNHILNETKVRILKKM